MATSSAPSTDVSMEDCFIHYHLIDAVHIYHEPGARSSSLLVASMIIVDKYI